MPTTRNPLYQDPMAAAIAAVGGSLGELFRPASAQEVLAGAQKRQLDAQQARMDEVWGQVDDLGREQFDRRGILLDLFDPTQSYYAVDTDAETRRYGYDQSLAGTMYSADRGFDASRLNNDVNARAGLFENSGAALTPGLDDYIFGGGASGGVPSLSAVGAGAPGPVPAVAGGGVPALGGSVPGWAAQPAQAPQDLQMNIPGMASGLADFFPGAGPVPAAAEQREILPAPPMSQDQAQAMREAAELAVFEGLPPEVQQAIVAGDLSLEQIVGEDGDPIYATQMDAIGQNVFVNQGGQAAPTPITFERNGQRVGGFVANGQFLDATGVPLSPDEAGSAVRLGQPQGSNEDIGVTSSNATDYNRVQQTVTVSNALIEDLEGLIRSREGAAGMAGSIQMVGQDLLQVGRELGAAFGGSPDAIVTPEMFQGVISAGGNYDPVFREIRSGMLQLAYLNAQRDNPRGEVSRFALERQIEALGQGFFANDQSILAALGMSRRANDRALLGAEALVGRSGVVPAPTGPLTVNTSAGQVTIRPLE